MQATYRDHAGNREPMFKLESNYSPKGNLPAIKQPRGHACAVWSSRLRCGPSLRTSLHDLPLLFRCPLQRLTLAHTASLDPGGPESDLSGLSYFERGTTQKSIFR